VTHLVVADVGSTRSDAVHTKVVVALACVAVAQWIVLGPILVIAGVFRVTSEDLSVTHTLHRMLLTVYVFILK